MKQLKAILVSLPVTSLVFGGVLLATVATTVLQSQSVFAQGGVSEGISGGASTAKGNNQPDKLEGQEGIFNVLLFLAGAVAVIVLIIGGIRYVISSGDSGQVQSAKNTILYAVVGLVVVIMAYAIVNFVINQFQGNGGSAA